MFFQKSNNLSCVDTNSCVRPKKKRYKQLCLYMTHVTILHTKTIFVPNNLYIVYFSKLKRKKKTVLFFILMAKFKKKVCFIFFQSLPKIPTSPFFSSQDSYLCILHRKKKWKLLLLEISQIQAASARLLKYLVLSTIIQLCLHDSICLINR